MSNSIPVYNDERFEPLVYSEEEHLNLLINAHTCEMICYIC